MAYVFYDLPADSADLETYDGYHVARVVETPRGSKPRPFDPPAELVLQPGRRPWFEPVICRFAAPPSMGRKVTTRAWTLRGFMTRREAASLLSVPSLCFIAIWLLGHVW